MLSRNLFSLNFFKLLVGVCMRVMSDLDFYQMSYTTQWSHSLVGKQKWSFIV